MLLVCLILASFITAHVKGEADQFTKPHVIILGQENVGKTTLANALTGEDLRCQECQYPFCHDLDSCTKNTTYAVAPWLGNVMVPFKYFLL